jgi:hypothetical protein
MQRLESAVRKIQSINTYPSPVEQVCFSCQWQFYHERSRIYFPWYGIKLTKILAIPAWRQLRRRARFYLGPGTEHSDSQYDIPGY